MNSDDAKDPSLDLTLLGNSVGDLPATPDDATFETFPNPQRSREYTIHLHYDEFTSLCPVTGQPDAAKIRLTYVPGARCVETKSLKLYLQSFRNFPAFNEEVVNRIADDLITAIDPAKLHLTGRFAARGGISLTVEIQHPSDVHSSE